ACASTPVYDPDHLADALNQPDAPFLNRALSAYSVGSVFKLVTAANALEQGFTPKYLYDCTGDISFYGQRFRCHDLNGHGLLDMQGALIQSCNPYFISLSRLMSPASMHDTAEKLGFGSAAEIANGLYSAAGYLPSVQDLEIEAERANMSFGQGKLLATPLQIAAMTACIGNDGIYTPPQLIAGLTADGSQLLPQEQPESVRVLSHQTAFELRRMMTAVLEKSKKSKGKPSNVRAAGKTSTAQTGQFAPDGTEYCHAWMTGFFPVYQPQYAVTVFVENGGSGNEKAAPLFREIIEQIVKLQS
ncbi:MAG: penicillin-binding protein 2, partial [Oscillospiraceae bacterium]|nr:penicillin-binding protein 2 [Oscillospiraceae bacterium]